MPDEPRPAGWAMAFPSDNVATVEVLRQLEHGADLEGTVVPSPEGSIAEATDGW
jgi:hypothetical protein